MFIGVQITINNQSKDYIVDIEYFENIYRQPTPDAVTGIKPESTHGPHGRYHLPRSQSANVSNASIKKTYSYYNESALDISVIERDGVILECRGKGIVAHFQNLFHMTTVYEFMNTDVFNSTFMSTKHSPNIYSSKDRGLEIFLEACNSVLSDHGPSMSSYIIEIHRCIDIGDLRNGKGIYVPEMDILVCDRQMAHQFRHPLGERELMSKHLNNIIKGQKVSGIMYRIVDNEHKIDKRFTMVGNELLELPIQRDKNSGDGVFISYFKSNDEGGIEVRHEHLGLNHENGQLGVFHTAEAATSNGRPDLMLQKKIDELKHQKVDAELQLSLQNKEHEKEVLRIRQQLLESEARSKEIEREARELKDKIELQAVIRKDRYEEIHSKRQDHYEERSHSRKDNTEWVKTAGVVLGTALTVGLAVWKLKSK
jgi:hypothetical protein